REIAEHFAGLRELSICCLTALSPAKVSVGALETDFFWGILTGIAALYDGPRIPRITLKLALFTESLYGFLDRNMILLVTAGIVGGVGRVVDLFYDRGLGRRGGAIYAAVYYIGHIMLLFNCGG